MSPDRQAGSPRVSVLDEASVSAKASEDCASPPSFLVTAPKCQLAARPGSLTRIHTSPTTGRDIPILLTEKNPKGLEMGPRQNLGKLHEIIRVRASVDPYKISTHESVAAVSFDFRSRMRVFKRTVGWDQLLQTRDDRLPIEILRRLAQPFQ